MANNQSTSNPCNPTPPLNTEEDSQNLYPHSSEDITFLEKIGSGGFGTVYKAESKTLGEVCAVKVIKKAKLSEEDQKSIDNEISILCQLDHPHVIRTLGGWEDSLTSNIIFDFETGGDLYDLLKNSIITEDQAKRFILELGSALDYIHGENIIHRDVKLENILLTEDGVTKLTDFGLAARAYYGLAFGDFGTPHTKAPEVHTQYSYTKAVDWWGVGVILYQLTLKDDPFKPTENQTLEDSIVNSRVKIPLSIPYQSYSLVGKLLQKNPDLRMNSFTDLKSHKYFEGV